MDPSRYQHLRPRQPAYGENAPYMPPLSLTPRSSINPRCRFLSSTRTTTPRPIRFDTRFTYKPPRPQQTEPKHTPTLNTRPIAPNKSPVTTAMGKTPVTTSMGKTPVTTSMGKTPVTTAMGKTPVMTAMGKMPVTTAGKTTVTAGKTAGTTAGTTTTSAASGSASGTVKKSEPQSKDIKKENEQTKNDPKSKNVKIDNISADMSKASKVDPPAKEEKKDQSKADNIQSSKKEEKEDNESDESDDEDTGFCKYCKISFNSSEAYYKHTRGLLHTQNMMAVQTEDQPKGEGDQGQGNGGQKQGQRDDQRKDKNHQEQVSNQSSDKINLEDHLPKQLGKSDFPAEFHCKLCDAKCNNQLMYQRHLEGNRHKNMTKNVQNTRNLAPSEKDKKTKEPSDTRKRVVDSDRPSLINYQVRDSGLVLIGMQYVTEFRSFDPKVAVHYFCNLCEAKCNTNTLVPHVGGLKHRMKYFKEHYPLFYAKQQSPSANLKKSEVSAAAEKFAQTVLEKEGNGDVMVKFEIDPTSEETPSTLSDNVTADDDYHRSYGGEPPVKKAYLPDIYERKSRASESDHGKSWMPKSDFGRNLLSEIDFRKSLMSTDYEAWSRSRSMDKSKWGDVYPGESDRAYLEKDRKDVYSDYHRSNDKDVYSDYHRQDNMSARNEYDRSERGEMYDRRSMDGTYNYGYDQTSMDIDRSTLESNRSRLDSFRQGFGMDDRDNMLYKDDAGHYGDSRLDTRSADQYGNRQSEMDIDDQSYNNKPSVDTSKQPEQKSIVHDYGHGVKRGRDSSQQNNSDEDSDESNQELFKQFVMWKQQQKKGKKSKQTDDTEGQQQQLGMQQQQQQQEQHQGQQQQQKQQQTPQQQQGQTENTKTEEPSSSLGDSLMAMASTMIRNEEEAAMALQVSSALTQALLQYRLRNATPEIAADIAGTAEVSQQLAQKSAAPESAPPKVHSSKASAKSASSSSKDKQKMAAAIPQRASTASTLGGQSSVGHALGQTTGRAEGQIFDASKPQHTNYEATWSQTPQQFATHGGLDNSSTISFDYNQWNMIQSQNPSASSLRVPAPVPPPPPSDYAYRPVPPPSNQYY